MHLHLYLHRSQVSWDILTVEQKKEQKEAENAEGQAAGGKKKKVTAAQLRVQKGESYLTCVPSS